MTRRSRSKRPKRVRRARHRGQRRQKLSKTVRELYPGHGAEVGDAPLPEEGWEEELQKAVEPPTPSPQRPVPPAGSDGEDPPRRPEPDVEDAVLRRGRVLSPASGACRVESGDQSFHCTLPSRLARDQQRRLAVGDDVVFAQHGEGFRIHEVLPRRTTLSRPDPRNPKLERVIAANVDVVVQVLSIRRPPLRPALIDRCLIAIERCGARALLCVNKIDLIRSADERRRCSEVLAPYRDLGLDVVPCSATTGEGLDEVRDRLQGTTAVLVGHSGVGKSSLLNALDPTLAVRTAGVSERDGRGRHTTTRSRLYRLPGDIEVIDTPGIREFGLFELDVDELQAYFPEFEPHARRCRFNDCRHRHEPDCAVRAAAADGAVRSARYAAYLRILGSLVDS